MVMSERRIGARGTVRLFLLQSAQTLLVSSFRRLLMVAVFCAARSAAGFGALLDMAVGERNDIERVVGRERRV